MLSHVLLTVNDIILPFTVNGNNVIGLQYKSINYVRAKIPTRRLT